MGLQRSNKEDSYGGGGHIVKADSGGKTAEVWWDNVKNGTCRFDNLRVISFSQTVTAASARLASRAMKLQGNIQDGDVMISVDENIVYVTPETWKGAA